MTFSDAVRMQETQTTNGMSAFTSTLNKNVDFFYAAGAMRNQDIIPLFVAAYVENNEIALRIAQWLRDVRGGAGERQLFRNILQYLEVHYPDAARAMIPNIPVVGRWDDLLVFESEIKQEAFAFIADAISNGNKLCAKWMPRQGYKAVELRNFMGWSPKRWRKTLVSLSETVETKMCANDWDNINFNHVPSLASARYKKAFNRHTENYAKYVADLLENKSIVHSSAVYPYDVLKGVFDKSSFTSTELNFVISQWNALPNFVGNNKILPMIDVSGSMCFDVAKNLTALEIAVGLGLYMADKNQGHFHGTFCTFSNEPELVNLTGNIVEKIRQIESSSWGLNTNINAALEKILIVARQAGISQDEMPDFLVILSDMQFDETNSRDENAFSLIRFLFSSNGYIMPKIVFWNLHHENNVPVRFNEQGVAMISGFSPAILKSVLSGDIENINPQNIMLSTVMIDKYALK